MRFRLAQSLSLLLLGAVLLSVAGMGAVVTWNLRNGFSDYLQARDAELLERFARVIGERAEQAGGMAALRATGTNLQELLREAGATDLRGPSRPRPPPRRQEPPPWAPDDRPPRPDGQAPEPPPPQNDAGPLRPPVRDVDPDSADLPLDLSPLPRPGRPDGFPSRVAVYRVDSGLWFGRPLPHARSVMMERPVQVAGQTVAYVRLAPGEPIPDAVDLRFLARQYRGIAWVSAGLLFLALVSALLLARKLVRPVTAIQAATTRIARGEFGVRLPQGGIGEIGELVRDINQMTEGLQRLEGARRRWVADISHELRTPIAVLRGEIEALLDGIRPMQAKAMQSLREEVLRIGKLVDDLHLLSLADLQALPCQIVPADALTLAQSLMNRYQERFTAKGLSLVLESPSVHAIPVRWDPSRIEQLCSNLLENSLRYTNAPGQVLFRLETVRSGIRLQVEDSPPGLSRADMARVFEPLFRSDAARSREHGGSGLGLAICEAIVRAHGGLITASASRPGGLLMTIDLPQKPPAL